MTQPHLINLGVHIGAGTLAIALGLYILVRPKGDARHRRLGRRFVWLTGAVTATAALGLVVFRFLPLFSVLTVLVLYQLISGLRAARTRERGPQRPDLLWTLFAAATAVPLTRIALAHSPQSTAVVLGGVGGLATVLAYDLVRWTFPQAWYRAAWPIEHIYKMNAALFGMISALVGNTVRAWQPWSQLLPTIVGFFVIAVLIWRVRQQGLPSR